MHLPESRRSPANKYDRLENMIETLDDFGLN